MDRDREREKKKKIKKFIASKLKKNAQPLPCQVTLPFFVLDYVFTK